MNQQPKPVIKIMAVDDYPVIVEGVRACLVPYSHLDVVCVACMGEEVMAKVKRHKPDVVLMDVEMPGMDGLETTRQLKKVYSKIKVLMFAGSENSDVIAEAIAAGAKGCIRKSASAAELVSAIERIHQGESFFSADVAQTFFEDYVKRGGRAHVVVGNRISERERQVLHLIVEGAANKDAAETLRISVRTVEKHRQRIMKKLGVHKATELVRFAITKGLVNAGAY